jgi:hypothetical protein
MRPSHPRPAAVLLAVIALLIVVGCAAGLALALQGGR